MKNNEKLKKLVALLIKNKAHIYSVQEHYLWSCSKNAELRENKVVKTIQECRSIHGCAGVKDFLYIRTSNDKHFVVQADSNYYENIENYMSIIEFPSKEFLKDFLKDTIRYL